jgi:hypothetical protein
MDKVAIISRGHFEKESSVQAATRKIETPSFMKRNNNEIVDIAIYEKE